MNFHMTYFILKKCADQRIFMHGIRSEVDLFRSETIHLNFILISIRTTPAHDLHGQVYTVQFAMYRLILEPAEDPDNPSLRKLETRCVETTSRSNENVNFGCKQFI